MQGGKEDNSKFSGDNDPFNIYGDEENGGVKDNGEKEKDERYPGGYRPTPEDLAGE